MKNGHVKEITAAIDNRRRKFIFLLPIFVAAVVVGFFLELSIYESMSLAEIRSVVAHLPHKFNQVKNWEWKNNFILNITNVEEEEQSETTPLNLFEPETVEGELEFWEQPTLLDLSFKWIKNNESICKPNPNDPQDTRIMPILVHTARNHFQERLTIRHSWGSIPVYNKWAIRLIFLLGEADLGENPEAFLKTFEEQEKMLEDEQVHFGDLVVGTFTDTYRNLTYKHMMGYKWILNFCRNAEFVMKVDDDIFIDIIRFLDWRSNDLDKIAKDKSEKIPELYCDTYGRTKPIREKGSKWYVSEDQWPNEFYPDYCSGWAYAITVDLIQKLYSVSTSINYFWIDDVVATGALLEVVKNEYAYHPEIRHLWGEVTRDIKDYRVFCAKMDWEDKREFKTVVGVPKGELFERDMMCMWNKTVHDKFVKITFAPTNDSMLPFLFK